MTATSDLDLIIVYDFDPEHPQSDGARSLYGAQYFARLTQRLISALSSPTNYGALYQVDMRLRPSGRSGPVATSIEAFCELPGDRGLDLGAHGADARAGGLRRRRHSPRGSRQVIRNVLCRERDPAAVAADVVEMRQAIAKEKGESVRWDLKYAAGGLIDLEFIAQYLQLVHAAKTPEILDTSTARVLDKAWRLGLLPAEDADVLRPAARLYHNLTQILRLCLSGPFDPKTAGAGLLGPALPRGRSAEFRHARRAPRGNAAEGARELQPHSGGGRSAHASGQTYSAVGSSASRRGCSAAARRRAFARFRSARRAADRRGAPPDRRRCGEAAAKSLARAAGSFSSIRFLLAMVCCCTNSMLSGRRWRS